MMPQKFCLRELKLYMYTQMYLSKTLYLSHMKNPGHSNDHVFKTERKTPDDDAYTVRVPGLSEKLTTLRLLAEKKFSKFRERCRTEEDRKVETAANLVTDLTLRAAEFDPSVA